MQRGALMCDRHWQDLPRDLRNALADNWNAGSPTKAYVRNLRAAVKFLSPTFSPTMEPYHDQKTSLSTRLSRLDSPSTAI
jgi:hypothetical protein